MKASKSYLPDSCKEICSALQKVTSRHAMYQVFEDWLAMSACAISNSVDKLHYEKREEQYLEIVKRYNKEEVDAIVKCFATLINTLQHNYTTVGFKDVLGDTFHALGMHNKYTGQFFTPNHICEFMGAINVKDGGTAGDIVEKAINERGYISLCEPCTGSGGMIIGFAQAMHKNHYNPQQQLVVTAIDIDIKCVHMTYLQLSLYGIPAVVIHGNSLTNEVWSVWYTPIYIAQGWDYRLEIDSKEQKSEKETTIQDVVPNENFVELNNGQMSLF